MSAQQSETEQVATTINEMTTSVADVAQNTEGAAHAAEHASQSSSTGLAKMQETRVTIEALADEVERSAQKVSALAQHSQQIGGVINGSVTEIRNGSIALMKGIEDNAVTAEELSLLAGEMRTVVSRFKF